MTNTAEKIWYLWDGEQQQGPFSTNAMRKSFALGRLKADSLVFRDGYDDWKGLSETELWVVKSVPSSATPHLPRKVAIKASPVKKLHDGTIAEFEMGLNCVLTVTDKHLRGQFLRLVDNRDHSRSTIKDQIDVLLNAVAGYGLVFVDNSYKRGMAVIKGLVLAVVGGWVCRELPPLMLGSIVGGLLWGILGWLLNPDSYIIQLNIMGSKTMIPIALSYYDEAKDFINKLQNAKIAYEQTL